MNFCVSAKVKLTQENEMYTCTLAHWCVYIKLERKKDFYGTSCSVDFRYTG